MIQTDKKETQLKGEQEGGETSREKWFTTYIGDMTFYAYEV